MTPRQFLNTDPKDRGKQAYDFFVKEKGYRPEIALGIVGNLMQESGPDLDTSAIGFDGTGSFGTAQWLGPRKVKLKEIRPKDYDTLRGQLEFIDWELNNTEKRANSKLQSAKSTEEAARIFSKYYERPHKDYAHNDKRVKYATTLGRKVNVGNTPEKEDVYTNYREQPKETVVDNTRVKIPSLATPPINGQANYTALPEVGQEKEEVKPMTEKDIRKIFEEYKKQEQQNKQEEFYNKYQESQQQPQPQQYQPQAQPLEQMYQIVDINQFADGGTMGCGGEGQPPCNEDYFKIIRESRQGRVRMNSDGSKSTHLMGDDNKNTAFPTLFRNPDGTWDDYSKDNNNDRAFNRATKENEIYTFPNREELIKFSREESWKGNNFADGGTYKVKRGDSLSKIAKQQGTTVEELANLNNITNPNNIQIGQNINLTKEDYASILDPTTAPKKKDYDYYNDPEEVMMGKPVGPTITEEQYNLQELDEVILTTSNEQNARKAKLKENDKIETRYKDKFETEGINLNTTEKTPVEIQQFLVDKGYDLNPNNKFKNKGVDGKIGKVTKAAIEQYNRDNTTNLYTPFKEKEGFLGECTETQCSEYVQNEAFRNINTGESRQDWNNRLGITGDAWRIGENIVKKGGSEINTKNVQPGDVVTIYTGGNSNYQDQADAAGTGTTHTALVDKVNPDGSYYILHNVHKKDGENEDGSPIYKGQEYRDLITNNKGGGTRSWLNIKNAYRPNYGNKVPNKVDVREDIRVEGSIEGTERFTEGINDIDFKNKIINRENLDEEEFYSLAKATLGIMGQETEFGNNLKYRTGVKEAGATVAKAIGLKSNEVSLGPGAMKINSNFNSADIGIYNVDEGNIRDPKNAVKATMLKLSRDYKKMISKGHSKKDALYRAIQLYNGMTKSREEKYADNYDFDYANKVLNFGAQFNTSSDNKEFSTIFDELSTEDKVIEKWGYVKQQLE